MKQTIIKFIAAAMAVTALVMIVGDMPDASLVHFAFTKMGGAALLWGAAKIFEHYTAPEEI